MRARVVSGRGVGGGNKSHRDQSRVTESLPIKSNEDRLLKIRMLRESKQVVRATSLPAAVGKPHRHRRSVSVVGKNQLEIPWLFK